MRWNALEQAVWGGTAYRPKELLKRKGSLIKAQVEYGSSEVGSVAFEEVASELGLEGQIK